MAESPSLPNPSGEDNLLLSITRLQFSWKRRMWSSSQELPNVTLRNEPASRLGVVTPTCNAAQLIPGCQFGLSTIYNRLLHMPELKPLNSQLKASVTAPVSLKTHGLYLCDRQEAPHQRLQHDDCPLQQNPPEPVILQDSLFIETKLKGLQQLQDLL